MFTGLVQRVGKLVSLDTRGDGGRITIAHEPWGDELAYGESVAVQGACLTVTHSRSGEFSCDVLRETLDRTHLGSKPRGALLNLERALAVGDRFGGHMVQGHVDGQGEIVRVSKQGNDYAVRVRCEDALVAEMVEKGSIAIDGVSLTIAKLRADGFDVHLIPVTWSDTSLSERKAGDAVNLETDIIGKYVRRHLEGAHGGVTMEMLEKHGYR